MDLESEKGSRRQELERVDQCRLGWGCRLARCECVVFPRVNILEQMINAMLLGCLGSCVYCYLKACGKMSPA